MSTNPVTCEVVFVTGWFSIELGALPECTPNQERSGYVWVRYESAPATPSSPAEYDFCLGRCEWSREGLPTYPDAARGVENPVCKMEWQRGQPHFVNIHGRPIKATHWHHCDRPAYPSDTVQVFGLAGSLTNG